METGKLGETVSQNDLFYKALLKIARARKHITELHNEVVDYVRSKPYKVVIERDNLSENHLWILRVRKAVPKNWTVILGDAIHNLRTALDLLACDLVILNGRSPKDVYFPFGEDAESFDEAIKRRHMDRAGDDIVEIVRSLKPYRGGNDQLRAIHDLDIIDKHRTLIPVVHYTGIKNLKIMNQSGSQIEIGNLHVGPVVDGLRIMSLPPAKNIKIGSSFQPEFEIVFEDGLPCQGEPVVKTLHDFTVLVSDIVSIFVSHASCQKGTNG